MKDFMSVNYIENLVYKNRAGVAYKFVALAENEFTLEGKFGDYWRYGGIEGQHFMDDNNLGFVDPADGPFISIGDSEINNKQIKQIYIKLNKVHFKT